MTAPEGRTWTSKALLRFADLDALGHVNSVCLAVLAEDGRMRIIVEIPIAPLSEFMLVSFTMQYLARADINSDIDVITKLARIGRTSFTLSHSLEQASTCLARAESVVVHVDKRTQKSTPLNEEQLRFLR